ncbi:quinone-dependent dihydroorotate dehydrogenase [Cesiribacter andamanensis]|uniref:Dihydroorotate dehydrogenase (quinone) n=1 Tax=Cesiribacter andamanensis AMV16 TaxID=1279009 RepID=M7NI96_9BACT|nr:quinone-dependent dihydroorotate dehydrogenase [Cesiribacter andamanensis]EMR01525.1 Dihydroorotate dehydrogenase (quinone) [Cesiribacter andamanensis AMV16]
MYTHLIRPLLFRLPAEQAHHLTFNSLKTLMQLPGVAAAAERQFAVKDPRLERKLFGLTFANPVGLAAGLDKNAVLVDELAHFGFGFIEIGTLTPRPQAGNPLPRLFRLPADGGLINRMGFNNEGVMAAVERLKKCRHQTIIGGNIGKNKDTPNEEAELDYKACFEALYKVVDYFVVNVSSPNTPNLRALQEREPLQRLILSLQEQNAAKPRPKPILLKIAPDLNEAQLDDIVALAAETKLSGLIATNTTISREGLHTPSAQIEAIGAGGLSGKPLARRSTEVIRYLHRQSGGTLPIIGVGGISTPEDALEKLAAGASLIQLYTGFIYEGPALVRRINEAILATIPAK